MEKRKASGIKTNCSLNFPLFGDLGAIDRSRSNLSANHSQAVSFARRYLCEFSIHRTGWCLEVVRFVAPLGVSTVRFVVPLGVSTLYFCCRRFFR